MTKTVFNICIEYRTKHGDAVAHMIQHDEDHKEAIAHAVRDLRFRNRHRFIEIREVHCEVSAWDDSRRASKRPKFDPHCPLCATGERHLSCG
jgi:hypothetical protein